MQEGSAARRERKDMLLKSLPVEAAEAKVCQARRMEIVGQLTGGVVHDFNNILTVISGTIEILAEAVADRPDLAAIAGLITEAAARGANLTSNLLAFARGQPSPPRDIESMHCLSTRPACCGPCWANTSRSMRCGPRMFRLLWSIPICS